MVEAGEGLGGDEGRAFAREGSEAVGCILGWEWLRVANDGER